MSVPNTVVKFVNRKGDIERFDASKIADAIAACIRDVEDSHLNLPDRRAQNYAERITDRIYRQYYDLDWLSEEFLVQYVSYDEGERHRRMDEAFVTERLTFTLMETFKDTISSRDPREAPDELRGFVREEMDDAELDPQYTHTLFPEVDETSLETITDYLVEKVLAMSGLEELPPDVQCPPREYIQDTIEQELKDMGEIDLAEGYMIYREGRKKLRQGEISELQFTSNGVHEEIVRRTNKWNIDHNCHTIHELNRWMEGYRGRDPIELVEASERRFKEDLQETAEVILADREDLKIVIVAGPSCSNKTTTAVILEEELSKEGLHLKPLNVDDYFHDLKHQPKDKYGDYDFEMPESIDIDLLNDHLEKLVEGRTVQKPIYDFEAGRRSGTEPFTCDDHELLLIDCLHGLYRRLTHSVPQRSKFRIYIESMNVVHNISGHYTQWADVRMLKRMIRDSRHRGYSMERTLSHWPYVRKGELKHIIPYIFSTDAVINSGMPYELPVLKGAIGDRYPGDEYIHNLKEENRMAAYVRGKRTQALLETVEPFPAPGDIPGTSPIREFIGGSSYVIPHND